MPRFSRHPKTFVIGDIHGCLEQLKALMALVPLGETDEVVFIGDYIDRGPDSKGVVDYVMDFRRRRPDMVTCLMGNHEWMLINYLEGIERELWLINGGQATLDSYGGEDRIPQAHRDFFCGLAPFHRRGEYLFVHAGIRPGVPLEAQATEDLLWIRKEFFQHPGRFEQTIVFGHTPLREVLDRVDRIGIDTGCVYGGRLTCLVLPGREVIQVNGIRAAGAAGQG
jgi:calcineurin-like phosphoesterase family protein